MDRTLMESLITDIENLGGRRTKAFRSLWSILMSRTCKGCSYSPSLCTSHSATAMEMKAEGQQNEEETFLAADKFIQELKKAPEWMVYGDPSTERIVLRVRASPAVDWLEFRSSNVLEMGESDWMTFNQNVEHIVNMKRIDRLHEQPETPKERHA